MKSRWPSLKTKMKALDRGIFVVRVDVQTPVKVEKYIHMNVTKMYKGYHNILHIAEGKKVYKYDMSRVLRVMARVDKREPKRRKEVW